MATTITRKEDAKQLTVTGDSAALRLDTPDVVVLHGLLDALDSLSPIKTLDFNLIPGLGLYKYIFKTTDGSTFEHTFRFDEQRRLDPILTTNVAGAFRLSEYVPHRDLRDVFIRLVEYLKVTDISVKWT